MTQEFTCVLCSKKTKGWGNNPAPVAESGLCCDDCNTTKVTPTRLKIAAGEPYMTYDMQTAALELGDKLEAFAEQYKLSDKWIKSMYDQAKAVALQTTGVDISEA